MICDVDDLYYFSKQDFSVGEARNAHKLRASIPQRGPDSFTPISAEKKNTEMPLGRDAVFQSQVLYLNELVRNTKMK